MYQFGLFDSARMHGVPSAVRFAELAMFRGSYSFNLFNQYRIDLFVDHARGGSAESAAALAAGDRTGARAEPARAAQHDSACRPRQDRFCPRVYRGAGSTVLQIMLLKPL